MNAICWDWDQKATIKSNHHHQQQKPAVTCAFYKIVILILLHNRLAINNW